MNTVRAYRVVKKTNQGYNPKGTEGISVGTIMFKAGYIVMWKHSPEVPLPIPEYDIEIQEDLGNIVLSSRLDMNLDSYRNLPEEFGFEPFS